VLSQTMRAYITIVFVMLFPLALFAGRAGDIRGAYCGVIASALFWLAAALLSVVFPSRPIEPSISNGIAALAALYAGLAAMSPDQLNAAERIFAIRLPF